MVTSIKALRERLRTRQEGERGLAMLDVLIGMSIFGLIAVIAISTISGFRARAYEAAAESDVRNVGIAIEAAYIDDGTYPADDPATGSGAGVDAFFTEQGGHLSPGNTVAAFIKWEGAAGRFVVCVEHESGAAAVYTDFPEIVNGHGVTGTVRTGGCTAAFADAGVHDAI